MADSISYGLLAHIFGRCLNLFKDSFPGNYEEYRSLYYRATEDWWFAKERLEQVLPSNLYTKLDEFFNKAEKQFNSVIYSIRPFDALDPSFRTEWNVLRKLATEIQGESSY